MQKLLKYFAIFTLIVPLISFAFTVSERPTGFVQDYAGILSAEQVSTLETKIQNFERNTTNEIAVVTIPTLDGDTIENVAQEIFTKWGIGKKDKNNGVLLLISLSERKTRIHTGYGVEGDLTDIGTSYIQREVITPAFRNGDYYSGLNGAVDKMIEALGGNNIVPENYSNNNLNINWELVIFIIFILFQWIGAVLSRSKSWWHGGVLGGVIASGIIWWFSIAVLFGTFIFIILILLGLLFDYIVSKTYSKAKATGHYPWFIGGGGHGSSSGGGFGGFGGGSSGGGGSSSSW